MPVAQIGGTNLEPITPNQSVASVVSPMTVVDQTLSQSNIFSDIGEGIQKSLALMQKNAAELEKQRKIEEKAKADSDSFDSIWSKYGDLKLKLAEQDMHPEQRQTMLALAGNNLLMGSSLGFEDKIKMRKAINDDSKEYSATKWMSQTHGTYIDPITGQAKQTTGAAAIDLSVRVLEGAETMLSVLPAEWSKAVLGEKDPIKQQNLIQQMLPYAAEQKYKANALNVALHEQELLNKKLTATKTRMDINDSANANVAKATTARLFVDANMILTNAARGLQPRQFDGKPFNPNDKTAYVVEPLSAGNLLNLTATLRNHALTSPTIAEGIAKGNRAIIQGVADYEKSLNALEGIIRNMTKEGKDISKLRGVIAAGALRDIEGKTPAQIKTFFESFNNMSAGGITQLLGTQSFGGTAE